MLSPHFSRKELACSHCGQLKVEANLLLALESLRAMVHAPVIINCGYRCPAHNADPKVGGALNSQHVLGRAADVRVAGKTARELYALAKDIPNVMGLGVSDHSQYLHLDVRITDTCCQWCYNAAGKQVAWYEA